MDETEVFLAATLPRLRHAETALHNGDAGPRIAMWSHGDSVTLFGGVMGGTGWAEIEPIFERLGASFSDCRSFDNEVIAAGASDDLAYTVAYEHTTASVQGRPRSVVRAARHHGVPPRRRRMEGGPPSRRPIGITSCRRGPRTTRVRPREASSLSDHSQPWGVSCAGTAKSGQRPD